MGIWIHGESTKEKDRRLRNCPNHPTAATAEVSQPVGFDRLADHFHSKRRSVNAEIAKRKEGKMMIDHQLLEMTRPTQFQYFDLSSVSNKYPVVNKYPALRQTINTTTHTK